MKRQGFAWEEQKCVTKAGFAIFNVQTQNIAYNEHFFHL